MRATSTLLRLIYLISFPFLAKNKEAINIPQKGPINAGESSQGKWYQVNMITPFYFRYAESDRTFKIMFIGSTILMLAFLLLPFAFIDGVQSCLVSAIGTFYWACHLPGKILCNSVLDLNFVGMLAAFALSIVALVFSVNEKFSNLFLSIGGGYIVSVVLCGVLGIANIALYIIAFCALLVVFVRLKSVNALLHFAIIKALVLSFGICMIIDLILMDNMFNGIYVNNAGIVRRLVYLFVFGFMYTVVFLFTYYKFKIREIFRMK